MTSFWLGSPTRKEDQINKIRNEKGEKTDTTKYKKLYGNNMKKCQQPGQPGRDGQVSRNTQFNKIESRRDT